jgi:hypothetical protein
MWPGQMEGSRIGVKYSKCREKYVSDFLIKNRLVLDSNIDLLDILLWEKTNDRCNDFQTHKSSS